MASPNLERELYTTTGRSSIGTELEFFVAARVDDGSHPPVPKLFGSYGGSPIIVPAAAAGGESMLESYVSKHVRRTITSAVEKKRRTGNRVIASCRDLEDYEARHLGPYMHWTVEREGTASLPRAFTSQPGMGSYVWIDLEVKSPALWATDDAFSEIHDVVGMLQRTYWICTPPSTALQFHYGRGKDYIPTGDLRKIAALIYAADPILGQLHPGHRHNNDYCLSNRLYSTLAHGRAGKDTDRGPDPHRMEPGSFGRETRGSDRQPMPDTQTTARFKRVIPRGMLAGCYMSPQTFYTTDPATPLSLGQVRPPASYHPTPMDTVAAVDKIFQCTTAPAVSSLMEVSRHRPAYDFGAYSESRYRWEPAGRRQRPKRSVEFRQAAGTIDPDEVVAHGRIVARLCEWASTASPEELWTTIMDCATAEGAARRYDVFDLLAGLGLAAEAEVLQERIAARYRIKGVHESAGTTSNPESGRSRAPLPMDLNWNQQNIMTIM